MPLAHFVVLLALTTTLAAAGAAASERTKRIPPLSSAVWAAALQRRRDARPREDAARAAVDAAREYDAAGNAAVSPAVRDALRREVLAAIAAMAPNVTNQTQIREATAFLVKYMPAADIGVVLATDIAETVVLALQARESYPWAAAVPWSIFLNDVLPYAFMTEPRDPWRPLFAEYFASVFQSQSTPIEYFSLVNATEWLNVHAWDMVDPAIVFSAASTSTGLNAYSPFEVMAQHFSSCTGLAIFIGSCLRSVGVPARVTGTPHWNLGPKKCPNGDASPDCGNHDWVEVWSGGGWSFIDPRGVVAPLNASWFYPDWTEHQVVGSWNHSIFATSWAPSAEIVAGFGGDEDPLATPVPYFPMVWEWNVTTVPAWEVTARYHAITEAAEKRRAGKRD